MEFVSMGWANQMGVGSGGFLPSSLPNLELWTKFNSGITVTGSGVSQWDDQSGNSNHLKQATDADRPSKESDGSILTDGISQFLKADAFTLVQPETIYILGKQVAWGNNWIFDGNTLNSGVLFQQTATPQVSIYAGTAVAQNTDWAVGVYEALAAIFNGASSSFKVGSNAETTGNASANNMGGFTLGTKGDASASFSNIQIKEVLIYSEAHDAATRSQIIGYLQSI